MAGSAALDQSWTLCAKHSTKKNGWSLLGEIRSISRVIQLQGASREITKEEKGRAASILTWNQTHIFHTLIFHPPLPVFPHRRVWEGMWRGHPALDFNNTLRLGE